MGDGAPAGRASRRDFLGGCAAAAALAGLGGCALLRKTVDPDVILPAEGGEVRIPRTRLPWNGAGGESLALEVTGRHGKILVFRGPDGAPRALDMTCTHFGCDVQWAPSRGRIVCPCHGSEYETSGKVLHGPAGKPLLPHEVREDAGDLVVVLRS